MKSTRRCDALRADYTTVISIDKPTLQANHEANLPTLQYFEIQVMHPRCLQ